MWSVTAGSDASQVEVLDTRLELTKYSVYFRFYYYLLSETTDLIYLLE